jgi:hypothetical protein
MQSEDTWLPGRLADLQALCIAQRIKQMQPLGAVGLCTCVGAAFAAIRCSGAC